MTKDKFNEELNEIFKPSNDLKQTIKNIKDLKNSITEKQRKISNKLQDTTSDPDEIKDLLDAMSDNCRDIEDDIKTLKQYKEKSIEKIQKLFEQLSNHSPKECAHILDKKSKWWHSLL